jgi:hypothetical protein
MTTGIKLAFSNHATSTQRNNLMSNQILSWLNTLRDLRVPYITLVEEVLSSPFGVIATLVDLEPRFCGGASERTAVRSAFGEVSEHGTGVREAIPVK